MYKTLKKDDIFYECQYGKNYEFIVITEPTCVNNQWEWQGKNTKTNEIVNFLITEGFEHYGPRIYSEPQYVKIVNGVIFIPINE